jgi:hypothetical protein
LLSGDGVDGKRGAEIAWFNEYHSTTASLKATVDKTAKGIALNPASALEGNKKLLLNLFPPILKYGADNVEFIWLLNHPVVKRNVEKALELSQNQTRSAWEMGLPGTIVQILE